MFVCIYLHLNNQKHKIMVEKLLNMKVGESVSDWDIEKDYDNLISTKSRLKRNGKGEWISTLGFDGPGTLIVKRVK